ncbi:hypothetical protein Y032_0111g230 [Ancylostoma ceylanicum]|uniref:Uncharacterized protein n=1 Tax=Ancylostoma ceylanicum TaxID=53326 RepID=A0A016TE80_9BILA|nr:hypothetical protein Y032_0111g230 [Ancylostoma ceylanicum]
MTVLKAAYFLALQISLSLDSSLSLSWILFLLAIVYLFRIHDHQERICKHRPVNVSNVYAGRNLATRPKPLGKKTFNSMRVFPDFATIAGGRHTDKMDQEIPDERQMIIKGV